VSEQTVQTSTSRPKGNVFTQKMGALPMWAWMAIILGVVVLYSFYKKQSSANQDTPAAQAAGNAPGGVDASLVPQFINQTYENITPPAAPNVTVNNTVPPQGPTTINVNPGGPEKPEIEPTTVSGSPGSFTTGLPGNKAEWTSTGKYSLNTIARSHGMTAQQLIAISNASENNVAMRAYVAKGNFNAPLPAGVQVFFPMKNWPVAYKLVKGKWVLKPGMKAGT
jgi:hypothetical protein